MKKDDSQIKGWTDLGGDRDWSGCGHMWCKKAKDGAWWVLRFENMREHDSGAVDRGEWEEFSCEVKRIDFLEIPLTELNSALSCCGFRALSHKPLVIDGNGCDFEGETALMVLLDSCIQYGLGAPLHTETANGHPIQVRGRARRFAEEMMRDAGALEVALDRPVNAIGSTAREYGNGDISSAMHRGPATPQKQLMRKIEGMPPLEESQVLFGTLQEDGTLTNVRGIKQSDMRKCPFAIMMPEHYREDGSCRCDDAEHRKFMIKEWEYKKSSFKDIPLRAT